MDGTGDAVAYAKGLLTADKNVFGFTTRAALQESAERGELIVVPGGAMRFHRRRDGVTVVYEIVVALSQRGVGIGKSLVSRLIPPIVAKCPEGEPSNGFWERLGFTLSDIEPGKKRRLNVWRKDPT